MGQLGKGRCSCGSGLKYKKCCAVAPPNLNQEEFVTKAQIETLTSTLLLDLPGQSSESIVPKVNLTDSGYQVTLTHESESSTFSLKKSSPLLQARAFIAAHLERFEEKIRLSP